MPIVGGRNPQYLLRGDRFKIGVKQQNMQKKSLKKSFYKTCKTSKQKRRNIWRFHSVKILSSQVAKC